MKSFNTVGVGHVFYVSGADVKAIRGEKTNECTIFLSTGHSQRLAHSAEEVGDALNKKLPTTEEAND